ncbi:MAG: DUF4124 domain-containing protein [Nevskiaceae bacterium]
MPLWLLLAALPLAAGAEVYRWVDEKGQVHYTQTPPPGKDAEAVAPPRPPADAPNQDALNKSLEADKAAEPGRRTEADRAAQAQDQLEQQCRQAREQLAYMDAKTARRLGTTDEQGNVSRVTEEQFQERRAELQRVISERCN